MDTTRAARVRARLAEVAADADPVDPALAALAGLASVIGLTRVLFPGRDGAAAHQRLREARSDGYDAQQATGGQAGGHGGHH